MSLFSKARRSRSGRLTLLAVCLVAGAAAFGARCIERTSTYVDADGYTHITGEMVNDTNIQATSIMLRGTLKDANGNVVAQKEAATCPPDTQPNGQTVFDIRFDNPGVPPWSSFEVRPISGKTLTGPLPSPKVVTLLASAARFTDLPPIPGLGITDKDVFLTFRVRNQGTAVITGVQGCAAVYNNAGQVTFVKAAELLELDQNGKAGTASLDPNFPVDIFMVAKDVPLGPTQVRAWLWFGNKGDATSAYQFVSTDLITIQTISAQ